jgi:hypothetical protein
MQTIVTRICTGSLPQLTRQTASYHSLTPHLRINARRIPQEYHESFVMGGSEARLRKEFMEDIKPLLEPTCSPMKREQIITSLSNLVRGGNPFDKKFAAEWLLLFSRDHRFFLTLETRQDASQAVQALNDESAFADIDLTFLNKHGIDLTGILHKESCYAPSNQPAQDPNVQISGPFVVIDPENPVEASKKFDDSNR